MWKPELVAPGLKMSYEAFLMLPIMRVPTFLFKTSGCSALCLKEWVDYVLRPNPPDLVVDANLSRNRPLGVPRPVLIVGTPAGRAYMGSSNWIPLDCERWSRVWKSFLPFPETIIKFSWLFLIYLGFLLSLDAFEWARDPWSLPLSPSWSS